MSGPTQVEAALQYATHDLAVLPLEPGGKKPMKAGGRRLSWEDASSDPEQVAAWWMQEPNANIGVACVGELVVLDIDGPRGFSSLAELEQKHGSLPPTYAVTTSRGQHRYFSVNGNRPADGWRDGSLELKANGYVIAPPSVHPSGAIYTAENPELPWAELPSWLAQSPKPTPPPRAASPRGDQGTVRLRASAEAAVEGELDELRDHSTEPGTDRHTALYAAACAFGRHVGAGGLTETEARRELRRGADILGLSDDRDTQRSIDHGVDDGIAEPYVLTDRPRAARSAGADLKQQFGRKVGLTADDKKIVRIRIVGTGQGGTADLYLRDGTVITIALADFVAPSRLALSIRLQTDAECPLMKVADALDALTLLRKIATIEQTASEDDQAIEWGLSYLQAAEVVQVEFASQADRWRAFRRFTVWEGGTLVLEHTDGTRFVRSGWFIEHVRRIDHAFSPQRIGMLMQRVGWERRGQSGRIKATDPDSGRTLVWPFLVVPKGWELDPGGEK